jgi:hypothetical protein
VTPCSCPSFFDREDGGSTFLRNVGSRQTFTILYGVAPQVIVLFTPGTVPDEALQRVELVSGAGKPQHGDGCFHCFTQSLQANARLGNRDSSIGIATGYGLHDGGVGVRLLVGPRIISSPRNPDRFWDPPSLLSHGCRKLFSRGQSGRSVKLTNDLKLVPKSRNCGSIHLLPNTPLWRSDNQLSTGTALPNTSD